MGDEWISRTEAARRTAGIAVLCGVAIAWLVALPYARVQGPQIAALLGAAICAALRLAAALAAADRRAGVAAGRGAAPPGAGAAGGRGAPPPPARPRGAPHPRRGRGGLG